MREKTGGRAKGTPNKTTAETKEILQKIVSKEIDGLGKMLEKLEPLERINAIAKLLPYILPRQSDISVTEKEQPKHLIIKVNRREN
ncbi:hypothetical protein [Flavobacterium sp. GP15]|uniref:hypothetical protein n=1 Tax=Flavobacterium sp. GP15 TaxID=2758567 RepID=UPI00165EAAE2|nr:hypothetical protein [Flavobacterium sp. GP15]